MLYYAIIYTETAINYLYEFRIIFINNFINSKVMNMKSISWSNIESLTSEEITYLLYTEGKDIKTICKIRNLEKNDIEKHIIDCKIKYRVFEGAANTSDIIKKLMRYGRDERISVLGRLTENERKNLEKYSISRLYDSNRDECNFYIWLLGECKSSNALQSIITFLKCNDGNVKRICCSALGKIGDIRAEEALISCLDDPRPQIKQYAIKALGKIRSKKAIYILNSICQNIKEKDYVIRAAEQAAREIEKAGDEND